MKIKFLLSASCVFAMMLTGCVSELELESRPEGAIPINLDGEISQVATRVNAQGFETGDGLGIYAVNYEDDNVTPGTLQNQGNQADHVKYVFDEANWKWTPVKPVYYKDAHTNVDLYAFYPYAEPSIVSAYNFEVQKDQSTGREDGRLSGYEASDFLWGKAENIAPTESKIKVTLNHKMSGVQVVLAEGEGFDVAGDWNLLDKKVLVANTTRKASINLATGEVAPIGGAQATGIVMCPQADGSFRAIVVPQTLEALTPLFNITIGGVAYGFKKSDAYTYVPGKLHTFTITINRKYPSGEYEFVLTDTQIDDWKEDINTHEGEARQYYCVHCEEPGTLGRLIKADKKNPDKVKHLKVSGKISPSDFYFMRDSMAVLQSVNLKECKSSGGYFYETHKGNFFMPKQMTANELADMLGVSIVVIYKEEIINENEIPNDAFRDKRTLINFSFPESVNKICARAFSGCTNLSGALVLPDGINIIGSSAFASCANLSSLSLPNELDTIESYAFYGCTSLSGSLQLPSTLKYVGSYAFSSCKNFTGALIIHDGLDYLGTGAFQGCSKFSGDLIIPESIQILYARTFSECSGLGGKLILHDNLILSDSVISPDCENETGSGHGIFEYCSFKGELILPSNITLIPGSCFRANQFSSIAYIPDGICEIGSSAFSECVRLMGSVELPESIISVGEGAFEYCSNLQEVILPSGLSVLKSGTFSDCFYLNKIVCKASEPPIITTDVFNGVDKNSVVVEVPLNSLRRYQGDNDWREFRNIQTHYGFSISRGVCRALNSGRTATYTLNVPAKYAWSINSIPEWVTVTPDNGVGKTNVTVVISDFSDSEVGNIEKEQYNQWGDLVGTVSYPGRAGEIIFQLDAVEGCTVSMKVEQYEYEYKDGDVIELQKASKGNGVDIVFMGDCYDAVDLATGIYLSDIQEAYSHFFAVEPYKTYREYFNVYAIVAESPESGMGTLNAIRDARFGSTLGENRLVEPDVDLCFEYACKAPINNNISETLVVLVENTSEYDGITYMWGDGSAIAVCPKSSDAYPYDFRGIIQHEAGGHGFGKLADEYVYHNAFISTCLCECCAHLDGIHNGKSNGWFRNIELTGDLNQVGWSHLIFHPKYSAEVDVYEGAYFHSRGVYRSEPTSCMNNNIPYFSAISRQAIVERIMKYAGEEFTLEKFYEYDSNDFGPTVRGVVSGLTMDSAYKGGQHAPVYMGDKPDFIK